jgi:hypothetical protein
MGKTLRKNDTVTLCTVHILPLISFFIRVARWVCPDPLLILIICYSVYKAWLKSI